jgi:uncharacterized protein (TIGR00730 family)
MDKQNSMPLSFTVYCASSRKVDKKYFDETILLADELFKRKVKIIYGGGAVGLMGALANRYLEQGGDIAGVIPEFMVKVEWAHPNVKEMHVVKDMHERKKKLLEGSDAVIALPGGTGTLEELSEAITLKRLGHYNKPILLLNTNNFYSPLASFFQQMADEHFLNPDHLNMWKLFNHPHEFWATYDNFPPWHDDALNLAQV